MRFQKIINKAYELGNVKNMSDNIHPLWLVVESEKYNKRVWITKEFGKLSISFIDLDKQKECIKNNKPYDNYYKHILCKTQKDVLNIIKKLIA